jgi:hypothetical protein
LAKEIKLSAKSFCSLKIWKSKIFISVNNHCYLVISE